MDSKTVVHTLLQHQSAHTDNPMLLQVLNDAGYKASIHSHQQQVYVSVHTPDCAITLIKHFSLPEYCPRLAGLQDHHIAGLSLDSYSNLWAVTNLLADNNTQPKDGDIELLNALANGHKSLSIPQRATSTARNRLCKVRHALDAKTNCEAIARAIRYGWI